MEKLSSTQPVTGTKMVGDSYPKELPQRGKGGARTHRSFCNKDQVEHQRITVKKTGHLKVRNCALFCVQKDARVWLMEVIPLMCPSATWGQCLVLSPPESPQGAPLECL